MKPYYTPKERLERFLPEEEENYSQRGNEKLEEMDFQLSLPPARRKAAGALPGDYDSDEEDRAPRGPWHRRLRRQAQAQPIQERMMMRKERSFLPRPLPRMPEAIRQPTSSLWRSEAPPRKERSLNVPLPKPREAQSANATKGWQDLLKEHQSEPGIQQEEMPATVAQLPMSDEEEEEDTALGVRTGARPKRLPLALRRLQDSEGWAAASSHQD